MRERVLACECRAKFEFIARDYLTLSLSECVFSSTLLSCERLHLYLFSSPTACAVKM
jgi:hypothetical protein